MAKTSRRLETEYAEITVESQKCKKLESENKVGNYYIVPSENRSLFTGYINGPENSLYSGGKFNFKLEILADFPFKAPRFTFTTPIYHININDKGLVCIDILKNNWSPAFTLNKLLISIRSLFEDPNPNDPLVSEIANLFVSDKKQYEKNIKEHVKKYAMEKKNKKTLTTQTPKDSGET